MALPTVCPAATAIAPFGDAPAVICGVLELSNEGAHLGGSRQRGQVSPLFFADRDAGTVRNFCCGTGITGSPCSYARCAIWRAARDAHLAGRKGPDALRDPDAQRPPTVDPELAEAVKLAYGGLPEA